MFNMLELVLKGKDTKCLALGEKHIVTLTQLSFNLRYSRRKNYYSLNFIFHALYWNELPALIFILYNFLV